MPDIPVTDDQRERLRRVQDRLDADVAYGHVRPRDAVEYLLDQFEAAERTESAESTTSSTDNETRSSFVVRKGGHTVTNVRTPTSNGGAVEHDSDPEAKPSEQGGETDAAGEEPPERPERAEETEARDHTPDEESNATEESEATSDDARLNSVMSLLDDNDEVWREADSGEAKYEVDLPDGTTERARTKDDVRAVLFKHYR